MPEKSMGNIEDNVSRTRIRVVEIRDRLRRVANRGNAKDAQGSAMPEFGILEELAVVQNVLDDIDRLVDLITEWKTPTVAVGRLGDMTGTSHPIATGLSSTPGDFSR